MKKKTAVNLKKSGGVVSLLVGAASLGLNEFGWEEGGLQGQKYTRLSTTYMATPFFLAGSTLAGLGVYLISRTS